MRLCSECKGKMVERTGKTPEGFTYRFHKCTKCGEGIVDMKQLHEVADKYRIMKKYNAKLSKWGLSLGLRIPKDIVKKYHLSDDEEVSIIPEKKGILIVPSRA